MVKPTDNLNSPRNVIAQNHREMKMVEGKRWKERRMEREENEEKEKKTIGKIIILNPRKMLAR